MSKYRSNDEDSVRRVNPYKRSRDVFEYEQRDKLKKTDAVRERKYLAPNGVLPRNAMDLIDWLNENKIKFGTKTDGNFTTIIWFGRKYVR